MHQLEKTHTRTDLETTTTATTLATSRVGGSGGDVLDSANSHARTGQSTEGRLGTGTGGLGTVTWDGLVDILELSTVKATTYHRWHGS